MTPAHQQTEQPEDHPAGREMRDDAPAQDLRGSVGLRLVCEASHRGDAAGLAALLRQGAPANPVWGPGEARRHSKAMQDSMARAGDDIAMPWDDSGDDFKAEMQHVLDAIRKNIEAYASAPDSSGIPLFRATQGGSPECVRLLLEAGARIDQRDNLQHTALMLATTPQAAHELLVAGADPVAVCSEGNDVLGVVIGREAQDPSRDFPVARHLVAWGVPLEWTDRDGGDRLQRAAFFGCLPTVEFLLSVGYPAAKAPRQYTALHQLCWRSNCGAEPEGLTRGIVRCLLAAGISPDARDEDGNTPLHEAITGDGANVPAIEALLEAGADPDARNDDGQTPLVFLYDTDFDYAKVVPLLLRHGANPLLRDKRGRHALDLARACAAGEEPAWREEQWAEEGGLPCGWKLPATPGDEESQMLELLESAARRFSPPDGG